MSFSSGSGSSDDGKVILFPNFTNIRQHFGKKEVIEIQIIGKQQTGYSFPFQHQGVLLILENKNYLVLELYSLGYQGIKYQTYPDVKNDWPQKVYGQKISKNLFEVMDVAETLKKKQPNYNLLLNNCLDFANNMYSKVTNTFFFWGRQLS